MKEGTVIDYNIRVMGFKWHWKSIISHYEPPYKFVDEQLKGPYKSWHHTHMFIEKPGGTLVIDEVRYAIINSPLDSIMHVLYIKKRLNEVFDYRMRKLKRKFS
nr:SRPBCC family protein [candidate division Zixibacteria bacterium]